MLSALGMMYVTRHRESVLARRSPATIIRIAAVGLADAVHAPDESAPLS